MKLKNLNSTAQVFLFLITIYFVNTAHADAVARLRLADRFLVTSILTDIFGPKTPELTREDIFNKPHVFGGACDLYEQIRIEKSDNKAADPETVCPGGRGAFSAKLLGTANLLRPAHVTRVCRKLVDDQETLKFALNKIFESEPISKPDNVKIEKAYNLFNPEQKPATEIINALKEVGKTIRANHTKEWSLIIYTLCVDPAWQLI